jgi:hypothetical protein
MHLERCCWQVRITAPTAWRLCQHWAHPLWWSAFVSRCEAIRLSSSQKPRGKDTEATAVVLHEWWDSGDHLAGGMYHQLERGRGGWHDTHGSLPDTNTNPVTSRRIGQSSQEVMLGQFKAPYPIMINTLNLLVMIYLYGVEWWMINHWWAGKDLEGSGRGVRNVRRNYYPRICPKKTEDNHGNPQLGQLNYEWRFEPESVKDKVVPVLN